MKFRKDLKKAENMWSKIFDINNQLKQVISDIKASNENIHAIEVNKQGLLYINSLAGANDDIATGKYCLIGVVDNNSRLSDERLKIFLQNKVNKYNKLI